MRLRRVKHGARSTALIAVLLIVMLLAVILLEFNYEARVNLHMGDNTHRSRQALYCAEAGVSIAAAALRQHGDISGDGTLAQLLSPGEKIPIGDGYCTVFVVKENGKININRLKDDNGKIVRKRVDQLLRLIDILNRQYGDESPIGYGIVPAMVDWVDSDDDVTHLGFIKRENEGAETAYYEGLDAPYVCKNAPFDTLAELVLVKGVTREIFEGRRADVEEGIKAVAGLCESLTVYGEGLVDINEASALVIESLSEEMTPALAEAVIERRAEEPFGRIEDLQTVPGMTPAIYVSLRTLVTVKPRARYFGVTATGVVKDFSRDVTVVLAAGKDGNMIVLQREEH